MKQKPNDQSKQENSDKDENEKSEEFENFENAVRTILSLSPEEAREIRKSPVPPDPSRRKRQYKKTMKGTHPSERLAEEMFRDSLISFVRMAASGSSDEDLRSFYDETVAPSFHSLAMHKCSDWAEANLEQYL